MRFNSCLLYASTFIALLAQAAPVPEENTHLVARLKLGAKKPPTVASKPLVPPPKAARPPAKAALPPAKAARPPAKAAPPPAKAAPPPAKAALPPAKAAAASDTAASCPLYIAADAIDISSRELEELEKRVGEEFWFRFDDPSLANGGAILQLASRASPKDFDDQAYKWISTDASKVTRGSVPKRVATIYVLPAGTRKEVQAAAKKFEQTSAAKEATDFVTKDNEPGDVGINGVKKGTDGKTALDTFRDKVIRTVVKTTSTKGKGKASFTTITKGKKSNTASKADQAALSKFC